MTITEGGYFVDPATGRFDPEPPRDRGRRRATRGDPKTVFGMILAGLERRRGRGARALHRHVLRQPPRTTATSPGTPSPASRRCATAELADWVDAEVAFPNGMVDRITPATGRPRAGHAGRASSASRTPGRCSARTSSSGCWRTTSRSAARRFERAGVQFATDVAAVRADEAAHPQRRARDIAYPSALLDIHFVHEAMATPLVRDFLRKLETEEIIPIVPPVPGTDLHDYFALIDRRFANPKIGDTIPRLCLDGSNRQPKFILPSTRDRLAAGPAGAPGSRSNPPCGAATARASPTAGAEIAPNDESWERLQAAALAAKEDPAAFLALTDIFGDLGQAPAFATAFGRALERPVARRHATDARALPGRRAPIVAGTVACPLPATRTASAASPHRPRTRPRGRDTREAEGWRERLPRSGSTSAPAAPRACSSPRTGACWRARTSPTRCLTPRPGWTEQDPEAWWRRCRATSCATSPAPRRRRRSPPSASRARCTARSSSTATAG